MTDFELITSPVKRMQIKLQLIGGKQSLFPGLRKYVLWDEYNETLWDTLATKTWEEAGVRDKDSEELFVIQEMDADVINLALNIDSNSDIRRAISLAVHLNNAQYFESAFHTIWLNRLIRIQLGLFDRDAEEYRWFALGDYMVTLNDYTYSAQTQQLNLSVVDLMASITEHRGNQIGSEVVIYMDTPMKEAIEGTVERFFPFTFNEVTDFGGEVIPYDLEFERGIYPYEIVKKIITLYPGYQHYYTPDGTYVVESVPMGVSDETALTADQIDELIISDRGSTNPQDIKNVTEIWGKELDADRTAKSCDSSLLAKTYSLYVSDLFNVLEEGTTFAFTPDQPSIAGQMIKIQHTNAYPLMVENGEGERVSVQLNDLKAGVQYVVKYTNQMYVLQGPSIVHAMCFLFSEGPSNATLDSLRSKYGCEDIGIMIDRDSPFTIDWIGERVQVLNEGEYADIYTTELGLERAYYEVWNKARVQDTIQLEMLYVPWLDVNQKVTYRSIANGEEHVYLIQAIQVNVETFTMNVTMSRFYPYYPWLRTAALWQDYAETTWDELTDLYWDEMMYPIPSEGI